MERIEFEKFPTAPPPPPGGFKRHMSLPEGNPGYVPAGAL